MSTEYKNVQKIESSKINPTTDRSTGTMIPTGPIAAALSGADLSTLALLAEGLTDKEMAIKLEITEDGVGWRLRTLFKKFQVHSRTGLLAKVFALRVGETFQNGREAH